MRRDTVETAGLYYETQGQGPETVLLLHGLGSSAADWALQGPVLAEAFRVMTVDLPGHGRSPAVRGALTVADMAVEVAALLARLGTMPAHLVGLSLGGCVALALALDHAACVRSLTLVNTFARLRPVGPRGVWRMAVRLGLLAGAPMPALAAYVARGLFPRPEQRALYEAAAARLARNSRRSYFAAMQATARFNVAHRLDAIDCPTLIIAGDRDQTVPRAAAHTLHQSIAGSRLRVIADSGHATPYDQAEVFNEVVVGFVRELEAGNLEK
jgi:pimeloyl-ACP methyl ester carboxylesterase